MHREAGHIYDQLNLCQLFEEIGCLLDDAQHEVQFEDYSSAQAVILELIKQAQNLQQLLNLIPLRSRIKSTGREDTEKDVAGLINLEILCKKISNDMLHIQREVDNKITECNMVLGDDVEFGSRFKISFCSKSTEILLQKEVSLADKNDDIYLLLDEFHGLPDHARCMFDQLNQCTPSLWLDDLLNISSIELEFLCTASRHYVLNQ